MSKDEKYYNEHLEGLERDVEMAFMDAGKGQKRWALMLFFTELELGMSNRPNKWVNTANIFYSDGFTALEAYANTKCPASQLVDGRTPQELENAMKEMLVNFSDEKWLEECLYPAL